MLHAVDIETLMRIAEVGQKSVIARVIATVGSFLDELRYRRVLLKSDHEPSVAALFHEISRRRQADQGLDHDHRRDPTGELASDRGS